MRAYTSFTTDTNTQHPTHLIYCTDIQFQDFGQEIKTQKKKDKERKKE